MSGHGIGHAEDENCVHNDMLMGIVQMLLQAAHDPRNLRREVTNQAERIAQEAALALAALAEVQATMCRVSGNILADLMATGWDWERFVGLAAEKANRAGLLDPADIKSPQRKPH